jgi:mannan endo-1,4-beta-mannosidase
MKHTILGCLLALASFARADATPVNAPTAPGLPLTCERPPGNTGAGLYVACGRLNNPDGTEFRIRGVNRNHYDSAGSPSGIPKAGFNVVRTFLTMEYGASMATLNSDVAWMKAARIVPVIVHFPVGPKVTCSRDNEGLTAAVANYVSNAATWSPYNKTAILNIANEWGPENSPTWRDQYIAAIAKLRTAGYTMPLMIDSGGCGQDQEDLLSYAAAVAASDPQHNVIFSFHLYGGMSSTSAMQSYFAKLSAQSKSNPALAFVIGEFGPGRNVGPSPTSISPDDVIAAAESNSLGWLAWAWDDNNLDGCRGDDKWFSMTKVCGQYESRADLTLFGASVLGLLQKYPAVPAKVY